MRIEYKKLIVVLSLILSVTVLSADTAEKTGSDDPVFSLDLGVLYSTGDMGFQIGESGFIVSELVFPLDGVLGEVRMQYRAPGKYFSPAIRGRYAEDIAVEGTSTDEDWFLPWGPPDYYSESDSEADIQIWDADIMLYMEGAAIESLWSFLRKFEFAAFVGYGVQEFNFKDENLIADYAGEHYEEFGPVATYDSSFVTVRLGGLASLDVTENFNVAMEVIFIPFLSVETDALWILRDYPFQQQADGAGSIVKFFTSYAFCDNFQLFGGVTFTSMIADKDGQEDGVVDGWAYEDEEIVPQITSEYATFELGATVAF